MQVSSIGKHHRRLREVRHALRAGELTPDGWLPVEGPHLLEEAVRSGLEVSEAFVRDGQEPPAGVQRVYTVGVKVFANLAPTRHSQGVIALVRIPTHTLAEVISRAGRIAVLCGLQDPGNVGTILRLADAFGCAGCISVAPTVNFYNDKVVRASAGSLFRLPHVRLPGINLIREPLKQASVGIIGTAPDAVKSIRDQDWTRPTAILLGNEGHGLGRPERQVCDTVLRIPCPGPAESLNTASAAAIVLYEAARTSAG